MNFLNKLVTKESRQQGQVVIKGKFEFYLDIANSGEVLINREIKIRTYSDPSLKTE
jgi:hypothetical protein